MPDDYEYYPTEIAEILMEMIEDMDCNDYAEQKEKTMSDLIEILYKVKDYGECNQDFKFLYTILEKICMNYERR